MSVESYLTCTKTKKECRQAKCWLVQISLNIHLLFKLTADLSRRNLNIIVPNLQRRLVSSEINSSFIFKAWPLILGGLFIKQLIQLHMEVGCTGERYIFLQLVIWKENLSLKISQFVTASFNYGPPTRCTLRAARGRRQGQVDVSVITNSTLNRVT